MAPPGALLFGPSPSVPSWSAAATLALASFCSRPAMVSQAPRCPGRGRVRWSLPPCRDSPPSGSRGMHSARRIRWSCHRFRSGPPSGSPRQNLTARCAALLRTKNVNWRRTTASFTVTRTPPGLVILCPLAPASRPPMTLLFVGSRLGRRRPPDRPSPDRPCLRLVVVITIRHTHSC